jgi:type I restriction enzyme S subunit
MNNCKETTLGKISSDWNLVSADVFCLKVADGTHDSPKQAINGKYLVTSKHIKNGKVDLSSAYRISGDDFNDINRRSKVDQWDVLVSMIGTVGEVCLINEKPDFAIKNVGLFKCGSEINSKWLYYFLRSKMGRNHLISRLSGTTQQYITLSELRNFPIPVPTSDGLKESIIKILSSLDDKIELLRAQNETLEKIAQGIFKEWFVDFTIDGKKLKLENGIPEGWGVGKLKECIDFVIDNRGKTPPIIEKQAKSIPMVEVNALTRESRIVDMDQCKKYVDQDTYDAWFRKGHPDAGDVLISTVGSIGQLAQVFDEKICIAQNIIALRHRGFSNYLYGLLKNMQKEIISIDISSVQPSIKVPHLLNIEIVIPPKEIKADFEKFSMPFSEKICHNNSQIQTLSRLRNTLLPKLMSGEIRVG